MLRLLGGLLFAVDRDRGLGISRRGVFKAPFGQRGGWHGQIGPVQAEDVRVKPVGPTRQGHAAPRDEMIGIGQ